MTYIYDLLLDDGTVGRSIALDISVGDSVLVELHNESGMPIFASGKVEEILNQQALEG